jgi:hypothetical protein
VDDAFDHYPPLSKPGHLEHILLTLRASGQPGQETVAANDLAGLSHEGELGSEQTVEELVRLGCRAVGLPRRNLVVQCKNARKKLSGEFLRPNPAMASPEKGASTVELDRRVIGSSGPGHRRSIATSNGPASGPGRVIEGRAGLVEHARYSHRCMCLHGLVDLCGVETGIARALQTLRMTPRTS